MAQSSPESLPAESKPAAQDLLGMHGQEDTSPSSDLRLETRPALQRQIPRHARHREPAPASPPWSPIPLVLGIMLLCLLFLITARIYGAKIMELSKEKKTPIQCPLSCPDPNTSFQEMPRDQSPDKEEKCLVRWSHKTKKSYLFSPEKGSWEQCKSSCSSHFASLLMISNAAELEFILTESFHYFEDRGSYLHYYAYWTGLLYNSERRKWVWADGTDVSPDLLVLLSNRHGADAGGACAYVQGGAARTGRCEETRFCICEKAREQEGNE